jgi:hypothetical protein
MNTGERCAFISNSQEAIDDLKVVISRLEHIQYLIETTNDKDELARQLQLSENSICSFLNGQAVISPMSLRKSATDITKFINSTLEYEPMELC